MFDPGVSLRKLPLDNFTLTEILRLHLLSSGAEANPGNAKLLLVERCAFSTGKLPKGVCPGKYDVIHMILLVVLSNYLLLVSQILDINRLFTSEFSRNFKLFFDGKVRKNLKEPKM